MATIANSPGQCCLKSVEHTGTARGTTEKIAGVDTYISRPANLGEDRRIILFFADVYGPFFLNSQLIMDYWASHGYLVLALDYFEGDPIQNYLPRVGKDYSIEFDFVPAKMIRAKQLAPPWLEAIREQFGTLQTKWITVGYCFGASFVMDCLATDWIIAGAFAHPAFLKDDHFKSLKQPLLLSCAETDHTFPLEYRRKAEDILVEKKATYHIQVFSGVTHGFALRGNVNDPVAKWAKEQSAEAILSWFNMFCAKAA
ncbi:alpha/beta-hydrolase [Wolfiporia cocos MD-104 SS10]|uniref:Alpha/beta-hydrolase n=1 Tax=Wolfiporia cocos (strain MD-104) TaxID=742152 RepID=A0A2H3JCF7_WOLCO|nr:alpha/beta-hydrolase [Wolfiporia cocos MD-104 SS10]